MLLVAVRIPCGLAMPWFLGSFISLACECEQNPMIGGQCILEDAMHAVDYGTGLA